MKTKILLSAVIAVASAVLLAGCIVVNVERTAPASPAPTAHTNTVVVPAAK